MYIKIYICLYMSGCFHQNRTEVPTRKLLVAHQKNHGMNGRKHNIGFIYYINAECIRIRYNGIRTV